MIKVYVPNQQGDQIGGGWTFLRNFRDALKDKVEFSTKEVADIFFITSASMTSYEEVELAKKMGKKIVFRVDNIIRDSRNRNTGTSRMKAFAQAADVVVYQSNWAQEYVGYFLGKLGTVIYNGVNSKYFHSNGRAKNDDLVFLFVHYNRDENKRFPEAAMDFHYAWRKNKNVSLKLVGRFSSELRDAKFDFFMNESVKYIGVIEDPMVMGNMMRQCDVLLYPSYSDACPNTVIEALACGMTVVHKGHSSLPEIMDLYMRNGVEYFSLENMGNRYMKIFKGL